MKPTTLTEEQEAVASALYGRVAVVAGPGSGKTRVLVARIQRLLDAGCHPRQIAALTFTNRAAGELEARLRNEDRKIGIGFAGTIHALCARLLWTFPDVEHALGPRWTVLTEDDRSDLLGACHHSAAIKTGLGTIERILAKHAQAGNAPFSVPDPVDKAHLDAGRLLAIYREKKAGLWAEDFDGLLDRVRLILLKNPDVRRAVQSTMAHVSVDEAQDLDATQDDLIELLCPARDTLPIPDLNRSLLFIGDPLQSIYGWRGGDPSILLRRREEAHAALTLTRNFRSGPTLVAASNRLAEQDPLRPAEYVLSSARPDLEPEGSVPLVAAGIAAGEGAEADGVADAVHAMLRVGIPPNTIAVLARTNRQLEAIADCLRKQGTDCVRLGEQREFLDSTWAAGAVAIAKAAQNPANDRAILRALHVGAEGIDPGWERRLYAAADGRALWTAVSVPEIAALVHANGAEAEQMKFLAAAVRRITAGEVGATDGDRLFGWIGALDDAWKALETKLRTIGLVAGAADVARVRELLGCYVSGRIPGGRTTPATLRGFLWWLTFGQGAGEYDPELDAVTLSTIHLAKGLEWDHVLIPGLAEGILPGPFAVRAERDGAGSAAIDEERRALFVAITRARRTCLLSRPLMVRRFGADPQPVEPSRFLAALHGIR